MKTLNKIFLFFFLSGVLHCIYNGMLPLHPDEAYYWLWSRHPELCYYDHPAMIAWMIHLFSFLGDSEAAVRFTNVFCMTFSGLALSLLTYRAVYDISTDKTLSSTAAWLCAIVFTILPATVMGYVFTTPDGPLILFWSLALYSSYLALSENKSIYYILTGIFVAFMITSKYTAVLFPASLFIYMIIFDRKQFKNKYMWLACLIGVLGVVPIIIWNIQNEWISIKFQYEHGTSENFKILWDEFLILLGGIQLLPTPIYAFIIYKAVFYIKDFRKQLWWRLLTVFFVFPTLFFLYKGLFKKMELNWSIIGFISAIPLMCAYVVLKKEWKIFKYGTYFSALLTLILVSSPFLPLPDNINISLRISGFKESALAVEKYRTYSPDEYLFSDHLARASIMTFYLKGHPRVYIPVESRFSQFTIWDKGTDFSLMTGLYMGNEEYSELKEIFKKAEKLEKLTFKPRNFVIYRVGEL